MFGQFPCPLLHIAIDELEYHTPITTQIKKDAHGTPDKIRALSDFTLITTSHSLWSYHYGNLGLVTYFGVKVTFSLCSISSFNHR